MRQAQQVARRQRCSDSDAPIPVGMRAILREVPVLLEDEDPSRPGYQQAAAILEQMSEAAGTRGASVTMTTFIRFLVEYGSVAGADRFSREVRAWAASLARALAEHYITPEGVNTPLRREQVCEALRHIAQCGQGHLHLMLDRVYTVVGLRGERLTAHQVAEAALLLCWEPGRDLIVRRKRSDGGDVYVTDHHLACEVVAAAGTVAVAQDMIAAFCS